MGKRKGKLVSLKSFDTSRHNLVHEGKGYSVMRFLQQKGLASSTLNASKFLPVKFKAFFKVKFAFCLGLGTPSHPIS